MNKTELQFLFLQWKIKQDSPDKLFLESFSLNNKKLYRITKLISTNSTTHKMSFQPISENFSKKELITFLNS